MTTQQQPTTNHYSSSPCPHCGGRVIVCRQGHRCEGCERSLQRTSVWSRVVGYYAPVERYNAGKAQEFKDRTPYAVPSKEAMDESPL